MTAQVATAAALASAGITCDLVADPGGGAALAAAFPSGPGRVLLPGAERSSAEPAAGLAAKALKEVTYHREHATLWVLRLAGGTDYSRERMKAGLDDVWPYVNELFESSDLADQLPGVLVDPAGLRAAWDVYINRVLAEADLSQPEPHWHARGGRRGYHSEHLGHILAEMQHLHRSHPGAEW